MLQQRLKAIISGLPAGEPALPGPEYLSIVTPDLQKSPMPDLSTPQGQAMVESALAGGDLLVLDNLSCLAVPGRRPEDYRPTEGLRAQIRFEKARSFFGDDARPFEVRMEIKDGAALWTNDFVVEEADQLGQQANALFAEGKSVRQVAKELSISKSHHSSTCTQQQHIDTIPALPISRHFHI